MEPGPRQQGDGRTVPWSATFSMFTLRSLAMKPMTEKMTKPAKMLVALLVQVTISVSLGGGQGVSCAWYGGRVKQAYSLV